MKPQTAGATLQTHSSTPKFKVASIFRTIDGEVSLDGPWHWSTFVRLGGCNLRCWKSKGFCDAPHTLSLKYAYPEMTVEEIAQRVIDLKVPRVTITGGEPLLQPAAVLSRYLQNVHNCTVTLETSGSIEISPEDAEAFDSIIMDVKPPSTEMEKMNKPENMARLFQEDFAKFVIADKNDFAWSLDYLAQNPTTAQAAFGPWHGMLDPKELLSWIEESERWDIMFNMQSHKYIWPECEPPKVASLSEVDFEEQVQREH